MAVTMRDVAERAQVSIKTVSRVVNDQGEIADSTRQRVLSAINALGYRPNLVARGLVSGRTLTVAMIIPQITDPFFPEMLLGAENVARDYGYSVFLCNTDENPQLELDYIDVLSGKHVDGVMLCGSRLNAEQLTRVAQQHRVAVLTSRNPSHTAVITIPGERGLYATTQHLINLGHRVIGYVGLTGLIDRERRDGYRRALSEHGLVSDAGHEVELEKVTIANARQAARELLRRAPTITAMSCYNDLVAIGVLQACTDVGRRVPDDLAVVGFDDIELASLVSPQLTTMHVARYAMGQMIMHLLLRVIEHDGDYAERVYVDPKLVIRESCGARSLHGHG